VPTSLCASAACAALAEQLSSELAPALSAPSARVWRVVALPHTEGCGVSDHAIGTRALVSLAAHGSVVGALFVEHGCETTHNDYFRGALERARMLGQPAPERAGGLAQPESSRGDFADAAAPAEATIAAHAVASARVEPRARAHAAHAHARAPVLSFCSIQRGGGTGPLSTVATSWLRALIAGEAMPAALGGVGGAAAARGTVSCAVGHVRVGFAALQPEPPHAQHHQQQGERQQQQHGRPAIAPSAGGDRDRDRDRDPQDATAAARALEAMGLAAAILARAGGVVVCARGGLVAQAARVASRRLARTVPRGGGGGGVPNSRAERKGAVLAFAERAEGRGLHEMQMPSSRVTLAEELTGLAAAGCDVLVVLAASASQIGLVQGHPLVPTLIAVVPTRRAGRKVEADVVLPRVAGSSIERAGGEDVLERAHARRDGTLALLTAIVRCADVSEALQVGADGSVCGAVAEAARARWRRARTLLDSQGRTLFQLPRGRLAVSL
jgi:hypothetical protein